MSNASGSSSDVGRRLRDAAEGVLHVAELDQAARAGRDLAYQAAFHYFREQGLSRRQAVVEIRRLLLDVFTADDLRVVGASESLILQAAYRGPRG